MTGVSRRDCSRLHTEIDSASDAECAAPVTFPELFALPVTVSLTIAARAFGISMTTAYRLAGHDAFPCRVLRPTHRYRVPTASLIAALEIELHPVHADDLHEGIDFARRNP